MPSLKTTIGAASAVAIALRAKAARCPLCPRNPNLFALFRSRSTIFVKDSMPPCWTILPCWKLESAVSSGTSLTLQG